MSFKAIELHANTRQRTGREYALESANRQQAVDELIRLLRVESGDVRVDPTRTMVHLGATLWTIVTTATRIEDVPSSLRRAGAKHKRVR